VADRVALVQTRGLNKAWGMKVITYGEGRARVELVVSEAVQNLNGFLHGGAIATLVDHAGTVAILSADRLGRPGVTTDLNVTYFAPGAGGSTVTAEAKVLKIGKTLAFVTVDVLGADGTLLAQGRMTKFQG
jgi:acyl-coenzyme A thioesterase 13